MVLDVAGRQGPTEVVGLLDDRHTVDRSEALDDSPVAGNCSVGDLSLMWPMGLSS